MDYLLIDLGLMHEDGSMVEDPPLGSSRSCTPLVGSQWTESMLDKVAPLPTQPPAVFQESRFMPITLGFMMWQPYGFTPWIHK